VVGGAGAGALPDNVSFEEATFIEPINTIVKRFKGAVRRGTVLIMVVARLDYSC